MRIIYFIVAIGLCSCQPDTAVEVVHRKTREQYVQSEKIRAMRARAIEGMIRRSKLRRDAMQVAYSVDTLTWFFLGTRHPDYGKRGTKPTLTLRKN